MSDTPSANAKARKKQMWMLGGVGGGLFAVATAGLLFMAPKKPPAPPEKVKEAAIATPGGKPDDQELWRSQSEGMLRSMNERLAKMESEAKEKDAKIAELEAKQAGGNGSNGGQVDDAGLLSKQIPTSGKKPVAAPSGNLDESGTTPAGGTTAPPAPPARQLVTVGRSTSNATAPALPEQATNPKTEATKAVVATPGERPFLTSASFVRATMISGLDAPTGGQASADPLPVFFRLTDKAILPNRIRTQVKECHAYGVGWGDLPSERAHIRLESLSCILKNGQYIDTAIKGHVIGEDGKYGVRGRLITKQGQLIANGIMAGLASGIGQGFSNKFSTVSTGVAGTVSTVSGDDIWKSGLGQGVDNGMSMLAQYYIKAAEKLFPVIEVDSARTVELAFTKPLKISGLDEKDYSALVNRNRSLNQ